MKPANILFEKLIQDGSIENDTLITASEKRRCFVRSLNNGTKETEFGAQYYDNLVQLIQNMKKENTKLQRQPLFMLKDIVEYETTPDYVKAEYKTWKQ